MDAADTHKKSRARSLPKRRKLKAYKLMAYVGQLRGRGDSRRWDLWGVSATPPAARGAEWGGKSSTGDVLVQQRPF